MESVNESCQMCPIKTEMEQPQESSKKISENEAPCQTCTMYVEEILKLQKQLKESSTKISKLQKELEKSKINWENALNAVISDHPVPNDTNVTSASDENIDDAKEDSEKEDEYDDSEMEDEFEDSDGDKDYSAENEFQETETEYAVISIHTCFKYIQQRVTYTQIFLL